jgi:hypothetical protein
MKTRILLMLPPCLLLAAGAWSPVVAAEADWRSEGDAETRLENLVTLVPGASHWMMEMGERYRNLYWAAKLEQWEFAAYQAEEIEALVEQLALARPKRARSAGIFRKDVFPMLGQEIAKQQWSGFEAAFRHLNSACMACHAREDHGFIVLPVAPREASSPVLNLVCPPPCSRPAPGLAAAPRRGPARSSARWCEDRRAGKQGMGRAGGQPGSSPTAGARSRGGPRSESRPRKARRTIGGVRDPAARLAAARNDALRWRYCSTSPPPH